MLHECNRVIMSMPRLLVALLLIAVPTTGRAAPPEILPLTGEPAQYRVASGDTLLTISRRTGTNPAVLARLNSLASGEALTPGTLLMLPTVYVPPARSRDGVVLNIPERAVYVFRDGLLLGRYPVAVGKPTWPTPTGQFRLHSKIEDPIWITPREMVRREGARQRVIPPGPGNPLGGYWMGWYRDRRTGSEVGFHATNAPLSISTAASHGCVRLYPEHASRMFSQVSVGTPIHSLYEPVRVGRREGRYYLSVWPDLYGTGKTSPQHIETLLKAVGLWPLADPEAVRRAAERRDGYPEPIVGEKERLEVNNRIVAAPIAPIRVSGEWMVPVRAVAESLGGKVYLHSDLDEVEVTSGNGRSLILRAGQPTATLNSDAIPLSVSATFVEGVLVAPLTPLANLFEADVTWDSGKALAVRSRLLPAPEPGGTAAAAPAASVSP